MRLITFILPLILAGCGLQGCYLGCTNGVDLIYINENLKGDTRAFVLQHEDCHIILKHKSSSKKPVKKELEADLCAEERTGVNVCKMVTLLNNEGYPMEALALSNRNNCGAL